MYFLIEFEDEQAVRFEIHANRNSALAAWRIQDKVAKANFTPTPALSSFPTPYFNLNEVGGSFSGPCRLSSNMFSGLNCSVTCSYLIFESCVCW